MSRMPSRLCLFGFFVLLGAEMNVFVASKVISPVAALCTYWVLSWLLYKNVIFGILVTAATNFVMQGVRYYLITCISVCFGKFVSASTSRFVYCVGNTTAWGAFMRFFARVTPHALIYVPLCVSGHIHPGILVSMLRVQILICLARANICLCRVP